jgi:GT2 family glycosyltransferase
MNPKISILIPSLRPEAIAKSIYEFDKTNPDVDYELIVVSPFKVQGIKTVWVEEQIPYGTIHACNVAFSHSKGDYTVYFSDDVSPTTNCLENMLLFMKNKKPPCVGAFKMETVLGKEIGPFGAYNKLYACYGCTPKLGMLDFRPYLDNSFRDSWADIDFSLRVWEAGGTVEICPNAIVIPRQIEDDIYKTHRQRFQDDFEVFLSKWHDKLGQGMERKDGVVNRRLDCV